MKGDVRKVGSVQRPLVGVYLLSNLVRLIVDDDSNQEIPRMKALVTAFIYENRG